MANLPKDPIMLLSVINTALRDHYSSLDDLAEKMDVDATEIKTKLSSVGYEYNSDLNQYK